MILFGSTYNTIPEDKTTYASPPTFGDNGIHTWNMLVYMQTDVDVFRCWWLFLSGSLNLCIMATS